MYKRQGLHLARQLYPESDMVFDFDQILCKRPQKTEAMFAWHSDIAYWPRTLDESTATISLALDDANEENGCLRVVSGSHHEELRWHSPLSGKTGKNAREVGHALFCNVDAKDTIINLEVKRGSVTIHNERIVHGSGGNTSKDRLRRTYIVVFRPRATVAWERARGFTHSHKSTFNWSEFHPWATSPPKNFKKD